MVVNIISNWFLAGYLKYWPAHQGSLNYVSCFASNTGMLAQSSAVLADITRQQWPATSGSGVRKKADESLILNPCPVGGMTQNLNKMGWMIIHPEYQP